MNFEILANRRKEYEYRLYRYANDNKLRTREIFDARELGFALLYWEKMCWNVEWFEKSLHI